MLFLFQSSQTNPRRPRADFCTPGEESIVNRPAQASAADIIAQFRAIFTITYYRDYRGTSIDAGADSASAGGHVMLTFQPVLATIPGMAKKKLSWDALVEERIQNAQAAGKFDNLPGFGRPCAAIDEPYEEHWWVRKLMRREGLEVLPVSLEIRRIVEKELARIASLPTEDAVRRAVAALNKKIRDANYRSVTGPASTTSLLDEEQVVAQWRERRESND